MSLRPQGRSQQPSRIVFAISHSEHAGAQMIWADLAAELQRRGHCVSLVALYPGQTIAGPLQGNLNWAHCLTAAPQGAADTLRAVKKVVEHLNASPVDIVFTALPAANVMFPLARLLSKGAPKIYTSHHSPVSTYNRLYSRLDGLVGATRAVTGVISVSAAVHDSLEQRSGAYRKKSLVIHNALPPSIEALTQSLREQRRHNYQPRRTIVASGRLAEQKNYPVLIKAMTQVRDATLEIIGAGPDEAALKSLAARCGVANRVCFVGIKTREATLELISTRDVFVQPSLYEGHSLALVEAAHIGIPMVVSNVPSQIEAVTRRDGVLCALTHETHDHAGLAAAITALLDDGDLRERYRARAETLGDQIRFTEMADAYEALLTKH